MIIQIFSLSASGSNCYTPLLRTMKNKTITQNNEYLGRGIHNKNMYNSLFDGNLRKMLDVISLSNNLDVQIRNNYLNIYYKGGCIAKVKSERSITFNKKYFNAYKNQINTNLENKNKALVEKFKRQNYAMYFEEAKQVMDNWFKVHPKSERNEQHLLSMENTYLKSDYTIIDLEYEVSVLSKFKCTFITEGKSRPKKPRFDIIAINKQGVLCVIELKKGVKALKGTSGLQEHWNCYNDSIGRNHFPFIEEMQNLLKQKQELGLIDKAVTILQSVPVFMFAYAYDEKYSNKEQDEKFENIYHKINSPTPISVIKIVKGSHKLLDL